MGSRGTQGHHRRAANLGGFVTGRRRRSAFGAAELVYRILRAVVHAGNSVLNPSLSGPGDMAKHGSTCARQSRRDPGIFAFHLVVDDVRRRHWCWHADLFDRRANLSLHHKPGDYPGSSSITRC